MSQRTALFDTAYAALKPENNREWGALVDHRGSTQTSPPPNVGFVERNAPENGS